MKICNEKLEARLSGSKTYFTGKTCPRGHISVRYVSTGACKECTSEKANKYHKDRNFASARRYREKYPDRIKRTHKKYFSENKEKIYETHKNWERSNIVRALFLSVRSRAKIRNIEFTITITDIPPMGDRCPIFETIFTPNMGSEYRETTPSLDRIDPKKGYIPGNVWIISYRANRIKNDSTPDELDTIARIVRKKLAN